VFFTATAPLAAEGHVNVSPKGLRGTFAVLGPQRVAYVDLVGSGIETLSHLRENGRITLMFCAFEGRPRIVRLSGLGHAVLPGTESFGELSASFPRTEGARSIVVVDLERVADSCGYGVPRMDLVEERGALPAWLAKKGRDGLAAYQREHNARSV